MNAPSNHYGAPERLFLLGLARQSMERFTAGETFPLVTPEALAVGLSARRACFVTLRRGKQLRGCMGQLLAEAPLYQAVMENACKAASRDPRFPPVQAEELARLHIEISVLSEPEPLRFGSPEELLAQLRPREHGVVLRVGGRLATFLPKVWEHLPDKAAFLDQLARKAGCPPKAWRQGVVGVSIYWVEAFGEAGLNADRN